MDAVLQALGCKDNLPALVHGYLDELVLEVLSSCKAEDPFASDSEYLQFVECCFILQHQIFILKRTFQASLFQVHHQSWDDAASKTEDLLQTLRRIHGVMKTICETRLSLTAEKPRCVKVCNSLQLSPRETQAFLFVLLQHAGSALPNVDVSVVCTGGIMAKLVGLSSKEFLNFISEGRAHIKQGLIEVDLMYRDSLSSAALKMPSEVIAALVGAELSQKEELKVHKTCVADVLAAEKASTAAKVKTTPSDDALLTPDAEEHVEEIIADDVEPDDGEELEAAEVQDEGELDLHDLMKGEPSSTIQRNMCDESTQEMLGPYARDVEYLDDVFALITTLVKIRNAEGDKKEDDGSSKAWKGERGTEAVLRELRGKERVLRAKIERRLESTCKAGAWRPRIERLGTQRNLCGFEKMTLMLLVSTVLSHDVILAAFSSVTSRNPSRDCTVGFVLWVLCDTLQERISCRAYFYKSAPMVKDSMIKVSNNTSITTDLMDCLVDIDRRMLDFLAGLDTEFSEMIDGSTLYSPTVRLEQVILPKEKKDLVVSTVANFDNFAICKKRVGLNDVLTYGAGLVLLFHGTSGTGKTMLTNALGCHLNKKLLLVNWNTLHASAEKSGDLLRCIFREAKLHNALIFFDECENFFESRQRNSQSPVTIFLSEIERFEGLIILATNRAYDMDEAMNRRITLTVEFTAPDHELRRAIWEAHMPPLVKKADGINFEALAMGYELSGGLIKNAVLSALSFAVARDGPDPTLTMADLKAGAQLQMRGTFQKEMLDRTLQPTCGLDGLVLAASIRSELRDVIMMDRGKKVLQTRYSWGTNSCRATFVLLHGPAGCGKRMVAAAIGYECGQPMRIVNVCELMAKFSAETYRNVEKVFKEARRTGCIPIFEDVQRLFTDYSGYSGAREALLAMRHAAAQFPSLVLLLAEVTAAPEYDGLDFHAQVHIPFPNLDCRQELWRKCITEKEAFLADHSVQGAVYDWAALAALDLSAADIQEACFKAAAQAVLQPTSVRVLTQALLLAAAEELHRTRLGRRLATQAMYQ
eukprot:GGOE01001253.1.p1 GENE.GGOE01001253.1~~GGOE01001253.1.p1  ORF type:complete len:1041 (-),score=269.43 GGOE01001253.1:103-3225(-)